MPAKSALRALKQSHLGRFSRMSGTRALSNTRWHGVFRNRLRIALLRDKFVTQAWHGYDQCRMLRIYLQLLAQACYMHVNRPRKGVLAVKPNIFQEHFPRERGIWVLNEISPPGEGPDLAAAWTMALLKSANARSRLPSIAIWK